MQATAAETPTELKFKRGPFILTIDRDGAGITARLSDPKTCQGIAFGCARENDHVSVTSCIDYHNLHVGGALFHLRADEVAQVRALIAAAGREA